MLREVVKNSDLSREGSPSCPGCGEGYRSMTIVYDDRGRHGELVCTRCEHRVHNIAFKSDMVCSEKR